MTNGGNGKLLADAFAAWEDGDYHPFFDVVADDVAWTVIGSTPTAYLDTDLVTRMFE